MKKKFKLKKWMIVLIVLVVVIAAAVIFAKKKLNGTAEASTVIQLQEVTRQDLSDSISLSGTVGGETMTNYSSSATADFATVNVKIGDTVKAGDVLATLETESLQTQIDALEKSLSNAAALRENQSKVNQHTLSQAKSDQETQLAQASASIDSANAAYSSAQNTVNSLNAQISSLQEQINAAEDEEQAAALKEQLSSLQESLSSANAELTSAANAVTEAKNNYNTVKSTTDEAIYSAQNNINVEQYSTEDNSSTETQLATLKQQLSECTITATADGIVTAVNVAPGDANTANATVITVETEGTMILTASVTEKDILKLEEGQKAVVTADALDDVKINGTVTKVVKVYDKSTGAAADASTSNTNSSSAGGFSVQITLEPCDLISGMSARAKVILSDKSNVLCVPYDLVQTDEDGTSYVLCAQDNGDGTYTAVKKTVETGDEVNYYTVVTGGEISEGDYVIMDYSVAEGDVFEGEFSMQDTAESTQEN